MLSHSLKRATIERQSATPGAVVNSRTLKALLVASASAAIVVTCGVSNTTATTVWPSTRDNNVFLPSFSLLSFQSVAAASPVASMDPLSTPSSLEDIPISPQTNTLSEKCQKPISSESPNARCITDYRKNVILRNSPQNDYGMLKPDVFPGKEAAYPGRDTVGASHKSVFAFMSRYFSLQEPAVGMEELHAHLKESGSQRSAYDVYDPDYGLYGRRDAFWSSRQANAFGVTHIVDQKPSFSSLDSDAANTNKFLTLLETNTYNPYALENTGKNFDADRHQKFNFARIVLARGGRALDCGAGIGRTAMSVLAPRFDVIDLVEPAAHLLAKAVDTIKAKGKLGKAFATSLELLDLPEVPTYDFINMQWVAMYLTDNDLIDFLRRAKVALRNGTTRRALTPEEATKRRLARAEAEVGSLPQMRRRLAALKRRGRGVLSDAEAAEYDRLEDDIERAELKQKKENKKNTDVKSAIAGDVSEFEEVNTTGIIFMKEMMARGTSFKGDAMSGAIIRSRDHFLTIFKEAGLKVHHSTIDETSDKDGENHTPSYMFALR